MHNRRSRISDLGELIFESGILMSGSYLLFDVTPSNFEQNHHYDFLMDSALFFIIVGTLLSIPNFFYHHEYSRDWMLSMDTEDLNLNERDRHSLSKCIAIMNSVIFMTATSTLYLSYFICDLNFSSAQRCQENSVVAGVLLYAMVAVLSIIKFLVQEMQTRSFANIEMSELNRRPEDQATLYQTDSNNYLSGVYIV